MSHKTIPLKSIILAALALITGGLIAACASPPPTPPPPRVRPTNVTVAVVPDPTPTTPPTPVPTPILLAPDDSCVECHTNQEMLIATAKEEGVVEELSEGEG
jgi:hypothetical protein